VSDRSSNVDFDDCVECAERVGSGVCSNCEADGGYCSECEGTGRCEYCDGTGRRPIPDDPAVLAEVEAAGSLVEPDAAA
jgi:RecJ-like exonuclease